MVKKFAASLLALSIVVGSVAIPNAAEAASVSAYYSGSFKTAWEKSKSSYDNAGTLSYGYNTAWINEDYAHGYHSKNDHYASVSNGNGSFTSGNKGAGKVAKIEVRHKGSSIRYSMDY